ncbi:hypothetical protein KXD40_007642 [Peronospora effusa]|uniref:RING-type domain-containing protein n=1 Tax=Peronospora effusa TaxID=542832 RepID=A0A3M6VS79_9STRA|nr:hypothetical protein DD238_003360 [Peronospora effusa]RQM18626.1 hypothetical protein DD237_001551 [Peronospora effusa]UIZ23584.1 hypothetical protein KXD40_007642 [Peronospora effusa]
MSACDGWHCPICLGSYQRPVLVSCCGQSFCRSCLDDALRRSDACPMCRSPLLSGPFSVTSNRALEEALTALATSSQIRSLTENHLETNFVDAAERKLTVETQNFDSEVQMLGLNSVESENSQVALIHREEVNCQWINSFRLYRIRDLANCRCRAEGGMRCVNERLVELRRQLRQWHLWCRVHWTSLQCVFYVILFFVFVFFLRVQEEDFTETTRHLRRPN